MSYVIGDLVTEVQNKLNDSSFDSTQITQFINNANREVHNSLEISYMQTSQNYTGVIGQASLGTIPVDMQRKYNLRITDTNYAQKLDYWTFDRFDSTYPQPSLTGNSIPFLWYVYGAQPFVFPNPSVALTYNLRYIKKPTSLTTTSQTPDVPEDFRQMLLFSALAQAFEQRDRYDVAQYYQNQYLSMKTDFDRAYGIVADQLSDPYVIT